MISNKATLKEYKDTINFDSQRFYNKCLKYLLEKVLSYLSDTDYNPNQLRVVLEERNHDYDAMLRYFEKVKKNPLYLQSQVFSGFNPFCITKLKKGQDEAMEVADFVSHAVYQLANKTIANFEIPETRYFTELSSRFAGDHSCNVLGTGIKCIHTLEQLQLDPDVAALLAVTKCKAPTGMTRRRTA
ncbi:DNA topoisomerase IV subunit B [Sagittula stellata E-37]|uniref:DNA topoisomerase IV subunit B n=1 Tax=Sagittula stellata (strain ATCC 700073 / DSM 11524 / E-37) TaxID=388399 RepID=A3K5C0_SAGS3|nr:DNA topoisomerase IV subunit B [Sagittula stellata E-37]